MLADGFIKPEEREPDINGFEFFIDAFGELNTSRPSGLGIESIPFTAIVEYSRIYEIEDFDEFIYIIRRLDKAFIDMNDSAQKSKETKSASTNSGKKNPNKN